MGRWKDFLRRKDGCFRLSAIGATNEDKIAATVENSDTYFD